MACASTPTHAILDRARGTCCGARPPRHARAGRHAADRRERRQRPAVSARAPAATGLDAVVGRRLPPRGAGRAHRRASGWYADFGQAPDAARCDDRLGVHAASIDSAATAATARPRPTIARRAVRVCIQNHDQVGNRPFGDRLVTRVGPDLAALATRAAPVAVPALLFQGEECGEPAPFLYFIDHGAPGWSSRSGGGRRAEFAAFDELAAGPCPIPTTRPPSSGPSSPVAGARGCGAVRRAAARAPRPAARRGQHRVLRGRRLAARAPGPLRAGVQLRSRPADGPGGGAHGGARHGTARPSATAACACPRAREH